MALVLACSCGSGGSGATPVRIDDLRYRIAETPGDDEARRRLARLLAEEGMDGVALGHLEVLERRHALGPADRKLAGKLLGARARARLRRRDPDALADALAAIELDGSAVSEGVMVAAIEARLAHQLRSEGRAEPELLERLRAHAPAHPLLALVAGLNAADARTLGVVGHWLWSHEARALGHRWLERYVERGGGAPEILADYADARRWWDPSERLGLDVQERLARANVIVCGLVNECPDVVRAIDDPDLAAQVGDLAAGTGRTSDPARAAAWVAVTLRRWLDDPSAGWLVRLGERVDLEAIADSHELPVFAAPTLLRASGRTQASERALDEAVSRAPAMPPAQRDVVVAELAVRGDARAWHLEGGPIATRMRARAVALDPALGPVHPVERDTLVLTEDTAFARRLAATWWQLDLDTHVLSARFAIESPTARAFPPWSMRALSPLRSLAAPTRTRLLAIAQAYADNPVRADRLAADWVGASALATPGALEVARLFRGLGDPGRSRQWVEVAAQASPRDPDVAFARGEAAAAVGALSEAEVHFTNAAGLSGDPGAVYARAALAVLGMGRPVWALLYGRRAQELLAPARRQPLYRALVRAAHQLGRGELVAELAPPPAASMPTDATDVDAALASADVLRVRRAAAWNPRDARSRTFLIERVDAAEAGPVAAELALIAMFDPDEEEAVVAAEGLARYFLEQRQPASARIFERLRRAMTASTEK